MGKIEMIGKTFGYLTVIEETEKRTKNRSIIWKCKCKCGNICEINGTLLRNGTTKSCGCLQKEILIENNKKNKPGKNNLKMIPKGTRFGKLTVLQLLDERDKNTGCTIYQCQCDCGKIINVYRQSLTSLRSGSCGCSKEPKGEYIIKQILNKNNILFETQKTFETCRFKETNKLAKFDFYIDNKYLIEFDGEQHFKPIRFNNKTQQEAEEAFKLCQEHDNFKNQWCKENNIPLIRIPYNYLKNIKLEDLIIETSQFIINKSE